jgi:hypothetical protein
MQKTAVAENHLFVLGPIEKELKSNDQQGLLLVLPMKFLPAHQASVCNITEF